MKAIMYHYIRPVPDGLPFFRYLHIDNFRRQLDWFAARWPFPSRDAFFAAAAAGKACEGVVLTFDDAMSDHYEHVLPELRRRGLWGIFYVPTAPYETGKLLDVHRIHLLLGSLGGARAMALLRELVHDDMLSHRHVEEFRTKTYAGQDNNAATNLFKRTLNYFISYDHRETVLDRLMAAWLDGRPEAELVERFYVRPEQLRRMRDAGMEIGSHGVNHFVMSKLDPAAQAEEISRSFAFLESVLGERPRSFCYPYGGFHSFTPETERLLGREGCLFSFNVEYRDGEDRDLRERPQALPRYDCNLFPYGRAHLGPEPPPEAEGEATGRGRPSLCPAGGPHLPG